MAGIRKVTVSDRGVEVTVVLDGIVTLDRLLSVMTDVVRGCGYCVQPEHELVLDLPCLGMGEK